MHQAYWGSAPDSAFRRSVDAMAAPTGFNINNSIRLHRLWQALGDTTRGRDELSRVLLIASGLTPAERTEAANAPLISRMVGQWASEDAQRIRTALAQLTSPSYGAFVAAMISMNHADIVARYRDLPAADRRAMAMNAGFLFNVTRLVPDTGVRARIFAMATTGDPAQYEAVGAFLLALTNARTAHDTTISAELDAALTGMRDRARWAFFSWEREGAMRAYVDRLDPALARLVRERLRD
jgi:hypothetical protein